MRITCSTCGKSVSTEVPKGTLVRGVIECPECIAKPGRIPQPGDVYRHAEGSLCLVDSLPQQPHKPETTIVVYYCSGDWGRPYWRPMDIWQTRFTHQPRPEPGSTCFWCGELAKVWDTNPDGPPQPWCGCGISSGDA